MLQFIKHLIQITFSPAKGWEDLQKDCDEYTRRSENHASADAAADNSDDVVARHSFFRGFLPFVAICSLSRLMSVWYGTSGVFDALLNAVIMFMTFFLSSQIARYLLLTMLPRLTDANTDGSNDRNSHWFMLVIYPMAFLAVVALLENLVKIHIALFGFLPFYSVFIIWKGSRFAEIPENNSGIFTIIASAGVLGAYYLLDFILQAVI